jgi:uncharacterized membrane protein YjjB (DUF3815 family)
MNLLKQSWRTTSGRILTLAILLFFAFGVNHFENSWVYSIFVAIISWLMISYLSDELKLKHKRLWQIAALLFGLLTCLLFIILKRKELSRLKTN